MVQKLFSQKIAIESYIDDLMEEKDQIIADKEVELVEMNVELAEKNNLLLKRDNEITKLENVKIETIKNLINNQVGFSLDEIAKITNTSVKEVVKIKNEM